METGSEDRRSGTWQVAGWVVDLDRRRVMRDDETLDIPDLSFRLLAALLAAAPDTVSSDELMEAVWGRTVVSDETLKQRVMLLRRALGEGGERLVLTDRGRGYRLADLPRPAAAPQSSAERSGAFRRRIQAAGAFLVVVLAAGLLFTGTGRDDMSGPGVEPDGDTADASAPRWVSVQLDEIVYLSEPGDADRFVEGLREALVSRLANLEGVRVQRGGDALPEEAARELGLASRLALSGSYQQAGYQARVVIRVEDLATGQVLAAREFDVHVGRYQRLDAQRHIAEETAGIVAEQAELLVAGS